MDLLNNFAAYIQKENLFHAKDRLLIAVSGGVDSVVLCELCKRCGYDFVIAHCNFQLRGEESDRDEAFVRTLAQRYSVRFYVKTFDTLAYVTEAKKSVEEAARDLRYQWFHSLLAHKKTFVDTEHARNVESTVARYILTAHHADDNIETVTMNFFRGTGIAGLRGILPRQGKLIRPLLFARRSDLELFAKDNGLQHVTDHTNLENDYTRNYFRNTIIPLVAKSYPEAASNILKNITRFTEAEVLYRQSVQLHRKKLVEQRGNEIHIPVLKLMKTEPLATILYEIIKEFGFTAHQTGEALSLLKSETGKYIQSATHRLIKNRQWLIISPRQTAEAGHILIEEKDTPIDFEKGGLSFSKIPGGLLSPDTNPLTAQLNLAAITFPLLLRKWKQGDYFYPLGMQKKKKLARFLTDQKLSLTEKENTWVIEMDKKIVWVVGRRIDDRFKIMSSSKAVLTIVYLPK